MKKIHGKDAWLTKWNRMIKTRKYKKYLYNNRIVFSLKPKSIDI